MGGNGVGGMNDDERLPLDTERRSAVEHWDGERRRVWRHEPARLVVQTRREATWLVGGHRGNGLGCGGNKEGRKMSKVDWK